MFSNFVGKSSKLLTQVSDAIATQVDSLYKPETVNIFDESILNSTTDKLHNDVKVNKKSDRKFIVNFVNQLVDFIEFKELFAKDSKGFNINVKVYLQIMSVQINRQSLQQQSFSDKIKLLKKDLNQKDQEIFRRSNEILEYKKKYLSACEQLEKINHSKIEMDETRKSNEKIIRGLRIHIVELNERVASLVTENSSNKLLADKYSLLSKHIDSLKKGHQTELTKYEEDLRTFQEIISIKNSEIDKIRSKINENVNMINNNNEEVETNDQTDSDILIRKLKENLDKQVLLSIKVSDQNKALVEEMAKNQTAFKELSSKNLFLESEIETMKFKNEAKIKDKHFLIQNGVTECLNSKIPTDKESGTSLSPKTNLKISQILQNNKKTELNRLKERSNTDLQNRDFNILQRENELLKKKLFSLMQESPVNT